LWNEGATVILFAVVFLVILKNAVDWVYGVIGIIVFSITIMLGFQFYKRIRQKINRKMLKSVKIKRVSLRTRIFLSMILLTLIASLLMAGISIYQFKKKPKITTKNA